MRGYTSREAKSSEAPGELLSGSAFIAFLFGSPLSQPAFALSTKSETAIPGIENRACRFPSLKNPGMDFSEFP